MGAKEECVMVCEYCGRQFTQLPEDGSCPGCGAVVEEREKIRFPKPPIGIYKNMWGSSITIAEDAFMIHREMFSGDIRERTIPYKRLYKVYFGRNGKRRAGWISVQAWEDRYDRIADTFWRASGDRIASTIMFDPDRVDDFTMVSDFLQQCAEIANAAREEN